MVECPLYDAIHEADYFDDDRCEECDHYLGIQVESTPSCLQKDEYVPDKQLQAEDYN